MNYILSIDLGTSSTRAMLYDERGQLIRTSRYPLSTHFPHIGWVELNPEEIWSKTLRAIKEVALAVEKKAIVACGLTNQRESTVIWNKSTSQCLGPVIVWQDRRTESFCHTHRTDNSWIRAKTGLPLDPYFSATKIKWLIETYPEAKKLANEGLLAFGTLDTFLIWRLTGHKVHATDITNASRTLLFNLSDKQWDKALLDFFQLPESILPEVKACDHEFGLIDKSHLGYEVPITGVIGDQQAALIGQGGIKPGMIKATFGTGGFLLANIGSEFKCSPHHLLTTICYQLGDTLAYGFEGSIYQAGTLIKWLRDDLDLIKSAEEAEDLARGVSNNAGVYLIPAFSGLGAPYLIDSTEGVLFGLSRQTKKGHVVRAALESVCYQTRDILTCIQQDLCLTLFDLRVDGGMVQNNWFLQFLASQLNLKVSRQVDIEMTARGAALVAARCVNEERIFSQTFLPEKSSDHQAAHEGWLSALAKFKAGLLSTHPEECAPPNSPPRSP